MAAELFNQRRWQEWRNDNQAFICLQLEQALKNLRAGFNSAANQLTNVKAFESVRRIHNSMRQLFNSLDQLVIVSVQTGILTDDFAFRIQQSDDV